MVNRHKHVVLVLIAILSPACAPLSPVIPPPGTANDACASVGSPSNPAQQEMFNAVNLWRQQNGLPTLAYSTKLEQAANAHARDMYDRHFFSHTNPDGETPLDRANEAGFCTTSSRTVGENIAQNQQTVAEVQAAWQNSAGHNENMLRPDFEYVGMGYYNSPDGPYWVQVFGAVE